MCVCVRGGMFVWARGQCPKEQENKTEGLKSISSAPPPLPHIQQQPMERTTLADGEFPPRLRGTPELREQGQGLFGSSAILTASTQPVLREYLQSKH